MGKKKGGRRRGKPGQEGQVQGVTAAAAQEVRASRKGHETPFPQFASLANNLLQDLSEMKARAEKYIKREQVYDTYSMQIATDIVSQIDRGAKSGDRIAPVFTMMNPVDVWMQQALGKTPAAQLDLEQTLTKMKLTPPADLIRALIRNTLVPTENPFSKVTQELLEESIRHNFDEMRGIMGALKTTLNQALLKIKVLSAQDVGNSQDFIDLKSANTALEEQIAQYKEQVAELSGSLLLAEEKMDQGKPGKSRAHEDLERKLAASRGEISTLKNAIKTQEEETKANLKKARKEALESQKDEDAAAKYQALAEQAGRHADEKDKLIADHKAEMAKLEAEIATRVAAEVVAQSTGAEVIHQEEIGRLTEQHQEQIAGLKSQLATDKKTPKPQPAATLTNTASQTKEVESKQEIVVTVKSRSQEIEQLQQENARLRESEEKVRALNAEAIAQFQHQVSLLSADLTKTVLSSKTEPARVSTAEPTIAPGPKSAGGLGVTNSKKSRSL